MARVQMGLRRPFGKAANRLRIVKNRIELDVHIFRVFRSCFGDVEIEL